MIWFNAHRKVILAAITAVLVIFVDDQTAQDITAGIGAVLVYLVPNDQAAVEAVYSRR